MFSLGFGLDRSKLDLDFGAIECPGHGSLRIVFPNAAAKVKFLNSLCHFGSNKFLHQLLLRPRQAAHSESPTVESYFKLHY